jgi:ABC-type multidrug transport system fused ATPase/permease subunit
MSFSIGGPGTGMGPRGAIEAFGGEERDGDFFNPQIIIRLLGYLRPYRWWMVGAALLVLAESLLTLLIPLLLRSAIDDYIVPGDVAGLDRFALAIAAAFVGLFLASVGQRYLLGWVGQRVLANLRQHLFMHLQRLSKGYHDRHIVGVTVSRVINDVAEINELLSQGLITLIGDIVVLVGIVIVMFSLDLRLALLTFTILPLMVLVTLWFSRHAKHAFRETRSRVAAVVGDLAEDISAIRVIQAFAQERSTQQRFDQVNEANREAYIRAISLSFVFLPAIEFLGMLATVIVLLVGGLAVVSGAVTIGVLVAFLSYVSRFFQPIQELSRLFTSWQSAMAAGEQVLKLLDTPPDVADRPDAVQMHAIRGEIELRGVSFRYRSDTPLVLEDINLHIPPGTTVALVGPTGAGKTSIASLVARFYEVTEGAVLIDGIDIRQVTQDSLHRQIAIVTQDPFLFSRTIGENISFSRPEASQAEVEAAARMANAHSFIDDLPEGYNTRILEGGVNLSVGQRQLISIARAILASPRILILDEATANIDTVSEGLIQEAIARVLEGRTALVIAHRLSTIRSADLICVVQDGRIVEQGSHADLVSAGGVYASLYERQFLTTSDSPGQEDSSL